MKVHQGKVHEYLGMTLDFSSKRLENISMVDHVKSTIKAWYKAAPKVDEDGFELVSSKRGRKKKTSAAPENLFTIDKDSEKLNTQQTRHFII